MAFKKISLNKGREKKYRWYHGALFLAGITLVERGLEALVKKAPAGPDTRQDDRAFYKNQHQAVFAPPGVAFPIAWTVNDIATIWGNLRVLNKPKGTAGRQEYLALQAASWGVYSLFTALHFGLRSPINALALTTAHAGLNIASELVAVNKLQDRKVAASLVPVLSWLAVALPTAVTSALWNPDRFYQTKSIVKPHKRWLKQST
ncbi:tryptophan-rich sensory protein [Cesiribacter sp. SM1]|uniref:tryptophan-rich sensory protein n=1 Tax=Cesiribacter sp. SM1 TaxID=2861196 RepID=UPI001CD799F0|nr:TspO/MBR family protein [Cesiribacter sp. SM1]